MLKVWHYIRKYWWVFLIVVVTIVLAIGGLAWRKRGQALLEILETKKQYHDKEIEVIDTAREKEVEDIKIATEVFNDALTKIDEDDAEARRAITRRKRKIVAKIVKENINDSDTLARELADEYGFTLVEVNDD